MNEKAIFPEMELGEAAPVEQASPLVAEADPRLPRPDRAQVRRRPCVLDELLPPDHTRPDDLEGRHQSGLVRILRTPSGPRPRVPGSRAIVGG